MGKYLYGAAVQGIQRFIFETDKLREIVGASEFVEQICTTRFIESLGAAYREESMIQGAAGNIRYVFDTEEDCRRVVLNFPFQVVSKAPGMGVVQAVVALNGEVTTTDISLLIERLDVQRNLPAKSFLPALMIAQRSPRTGHAAVDMQHGALISRRQQLKDKIMRRAANSLAGKMGVPDAKMPEGDIGEIFTNDEDNDEWIAVMHADGNNLGKLIMAINAHLEDSRADVKGFFRTFSKGLDKATGAAASQACKAVFGQQMAAGKLLPVRPVLLGGDDLTVIIKARHAMDFTSEFMAAFEAQTKEIIWPLIKDYAGLEAFKGGLSTCAGIAYVKPNYPFHYAANLAEKLCKSAKNVAKGINKNYSPSGLMFHQVHSSFVGEWKEIVAREMTAEGGRRFDNGPYFLHPQEQYDTIDDLQKWKTEINVKGAPKSQLRKLITEYTDHPEGAVQYEARLRALEGDRGKRNLIKLGFDGDTIFKERVGLEDRFSAAWDIIKLSTLET